MTYKTAKSRTASFTEGVFFLSFAVRQLHTEFLRAGADVMQTFTFYAREDKLTNRGHTAGNIGVTYYKKKKLKYLTIISRARVGYEMIDSQRGV